MNRAILTKSEAEKIIKAQKLGHSVVLASFDLGKSTKEVLIEGKSVVVDGAKIPIAALEKLKENTCYVLEKNEENIAEFKAVEFFGKNTNFYYKLKPTKDWPTITLSSVPMHRHKQISPKESAKLMLDEISPITGIFLDTCCGLGYTAIGAASFSKDVNEVLVFENDENVLRIAEYNPYSEELFFNKKIKLVHEDVFDGIKKLKSDYFDRILHDPPTVSFAKKLYSVEFYKELFRVAKKGAIIYHYCPNPGKTKGKILWPQVKKHLEKAGFSSVKYNEKSSGARAVKK